jgi:AraC-like DNA-binding protein
LSFGAWRRRVRLLEAMVMQVQGDAMARIAATVGYGSPRALQTMVRRTLAAHMHKL